MSISKCGGHGTLSGWRRTISSRFRRQWCSRERIGVRKGRLDRWPGRCGNGLVPTAIDEVLRRMDLEIIETSFGRTCYRRTPNSRGNVLQPYSRAYWFFVDEVPNPGDQCAGQSNTITTNPAPRCIRQRTVEIIGLRRDAKR